MRRGLIMVDLKEEQRYRQLRKLGQDLHIPIAEAFLTLEVFGKDGKLIQRHHQRSHSWTRNLYNFMWGWTAANNYGHGGYAAGGTALKAITGATVTNLLYGWVFDPEEVGHGYRGAIGITDQGIQVGTGVTAESFEDYVLDTLVAHGNGAGQLAYQAGEAPVLSYVPLTLTTTASRYFNNNSGGSIVVAEVGIVSDPAYGSAGGNHYHIMMARDLLGATVSVPDTGQLKVTYTIQLVYPA